MRLPSESWSFVLSLNGISDQHYLKMISRRTSVQNYSHALNIDMLNQRYWHRRVQQCKAEFKANQPRRSAPKWTQASASKSVSPSSYSSSDYSSERPSPSYSSERSSSDYPSQVSSSPRTAGRSSYSRSERDGRSRPSTRTVMSQPLETITHCPDEQPSQPEPGLTANPGIINNSGMTPGMTKERPIPAASKSSRPIKYQVR